MNRVTVPVGIVRTPLPPIIEPPPNKAFPPIVRVETVNPERAEVRSTLPPMIWSEPIVSVNPLRSNPPELLIVTALVFEIWSDAESNNPSTPTSSPTMMLPPAPTAPSIADFARVKVPPLTVVAPV